MGQQQGFNLFHVLGGFPQPVQNRLFPNPLDPVNGGQTVPFGVRPNLLP